MTFNTTVETLTHIAYTPIRLLTSIPRPHFTFVPAAHVKFKADSIAMVLMCILKQVWMYVEGWRDNRWRRRKDLEQRRETKERGKKKTKLCRSVGRNKGRGKVLLRGRWTLVMH
jgi:hypothetical protein